MCKIRPNSKIKKVRRINRPHLQRSNTFKFRILYNHRLWNVHSKHFQITSFLFKMRTPNKKASKLDRAGTLHIGTKEVKSGSSKRNRFRYTAATELENVWYGDIATYLSSCSFFCTTRIGTPVPLYLVGNITSECFVVSKKFVFCFSSSTVFFFVKHFVWKLPYYQLPKWVITVSFLRKRVK